MTTPDGKRFKKASGRQLTLEAPSKDGEYFVTLEVMDEAGRSDASTTYFEVEGGQAREVDLMYEHPEWVDDAVIYAPIPALFGNGGPKAVKRRLPYLKKLGVDALWLWPPTSLRTAGEEYAIDDYFETDPEWGPDQALREMIDEAHRLGMYVLIDFVPNHMSAESDYFKETEELGQRSGYWNFFDRKSGEPTHYFDWDHLPNLNFDNPEVRRMIMEASAYWVRDMGVDGFRMDVAWGVKKRAPGFWPRWRRELKRIDPDLLLLAEASAVDPYYFSNGFDLAYDWSKELGNWAWASAFEFPQEAGALLLSSLTNGHRGYAKDAFIMRFLNNNDTGIRFVDQHGAKLTKTAATMQFTLPGLPAMFAGDEIGASYEPYSNLTRIPWRDKHDLMPTYERLIDLKHSESALESREFELLESDKGSVLGYVRPAFAGGKAILTILNFGGKGRVEVSGRALAAAGFGPGTTRDLVTGDEVRLSGNSGSLVVTMEGESAIVVGGGR
jgi:glycosidase